MPPRAEPKHRDALPLDDGTAVEVLRAFVAGAWDDGKMADVLRGLQATPPGPLPELPPGPDDDRGQAMAVWEAILRTTYERGAWAVAVRAMHYWTQMAFEGGHTVEGITVDGIKHFLGISDDEEADEGEDGDDGDNTEGGG